MRKTILSIVAALGLALLASAARADITLNFQTAGGTGALSDYVILRFYAKVNPIGSEAGATGLQSIDATLTTSANQLFKFINQDPFKPDVLGQSTLQPATNTSTAGTFFRVGGPACFNLVLVSPPITPRLDPDGNPIPPDYS